MPAIAFVVLTLFFGWMILVGFGNIRGAKEGDVLYGGSISEAILVLFGGRVYQGCLGLLLIIGGIAGFAWLVVETF